MKPDQKQTIRKEIRSRRLALSEADQIESAKALADQANQIHSIKRANKVASYRAFAGEIRTDWLETILTGQLFLPTITNFKLSQMRFYAATGETSRSNLGIMEPDTEGDPMSPDQLELVFVPLVAFRRDGARLGMGAGFYDRAFEFRADRQAPKKPLMIGLAHHFQERQELDPDPWDVPLDVIITDREVIEP